MFTNIYIHLLTNIPCQPFLVEKKNISSSVGKGRRRSLLPKVNWELRNFDCSYKSPFQLASILLPLFHLLYRSWFASFCSHFHVMSLIALIYHKLVVASKRLVTYSYPLHGSQFPSLQSKYQTMIWRKVTLDCPKWHWIALRETVKNVLADFVR